MGGTLASSRYSCRSAQPCHAAGTRTCQTKSMKRTQRTPWLATAALVALIVSSIAAPRTFGWGAGLVAAADEEPTDGDPIADESVIDAASRVPADVPRQSSSGVQSTSDNRSKIAIAVIAATVALIAVLLLRRKRR